jgi:hypothetical protein
MTTSDVTRSVSRHNNDNINVPYLINTSVPTFLTMLKCRLDSITTPPLS